MRIPLDYYRILGVPIQASAEQLQQAYRDRTLQLPRREYSEMAIAARKQLLDEAYAVLSDPEQRSAYDISFLNKPYPPDGNQPSQTPTPDAAVSLAASAYPDQPSIEIQDRLFVGAMLIFQELGEYELVLKLSRAYLSKTSVEIENGQFGDPTVIRQDVLLTFALACLELGREQWQQHRYEEAAESLNTGQDLLLREGLFTSVRGEMQGDLYKLRPYRILELVALPEEKVQERRRGLQLLREMLHERGGMDGTGNDQSGLSVDDFLRFVQQLRGYLTSAEQQALFEEEARRPSAVATYLAVYALLARGFTQRQPALIRRAKLMLIRLGKRQDVYLEQAVCAILLGQTEEASRALELSGEYESLAFIREHSQESPDLLPGLCLYSERWLQSEVFPHFRDLAKQEVSLKDYFADEQVQMALESLPPETEAASEWEALQSHSIASQASSNKPLVLGRPSEPDTTARSKSQSQRSSTVIQSQSGAAALPGTAAAVSSRFGKSGPSNVQTLPAAERVATGATTPEGKSGKSLETPASEGQRRTLAPAEGEARRVAATPEGTTAQPGSPEAAAQQPRRFSGGRGRRGQRGNRWPKLNIKGWSLAGWRNLLPSPGTPLSSEQRNRLVLLAIAAILGLGFLVFLLVKGIGWAQRSFSGPTLQGEQPMVRLDEPLFVPPQTPPTNPLAAPGPLTRETAEAAIATWLAVKTEAFGSDHKIDQLEKILLNPALGRMQNLARDARRNNWHRQFQHTIARDSIQVREIGPNQARVEAQVREVAQHYRGTQLIRRESYDSPLRVRYDMVRQNGQWYIREIRS